MQVTVIKRLDRIEIIADQNELPLDVPVVLYTCDEAAKHMGYCAEELLQLQSIIAEDEEDWSEALDALAKQSCTARVSM
jgi:hypothetical protein